MQEDILRRVSAEIELNNSMQHYGVKGMKWGVRRARDSVQKAVGDAKEKQATKKADKAKPTSADAASASTHKRVARNAGLDKLSNQELQSLVTRMNLEKQYNELTRGQNVTIEKRIGRILSESGSELATSVSNHGDFQKSMTKAFKKEMSPRDRHGEIIKKSN